MTDMNVPSNWYESFFNGVAVELWRDAIPSAQTEREADLILQLLEPGPEAAILDVPCGLGRVACVLDSRGYRLTGVDLSGESLAHARALESRIAWECRDMRDLPW